VTVLLTKEEPPEEESLLGL